MRVEQEWILVCFSCDEPEEQALDNVILNILQYRISVPRGEGEATSF
jgi:hypothetical protein